MLKIPPLYLRLEPGKSQNVGLSAYAAIILIQRLALDMANDLLDGRRL